MSPEQMAEHRAAAQVVSNPTKFSSAGTDVGTYRVNTAPEADEARTSSGAPVGTRQLRDNDRVTIDGVEVRVKEARCLGWIEEDATGNRPFVRG